MKEYNCHTLVELAVRQEECMVPLRLVRWALSHAHVNLKQYDTFEVRFRIKMCEQPNLPILGLVHIQNLYVPQNANLFCGA